MYCPKCGQINEDTAKFCSKCGAPLGAQAPGMRVTGPAEGTGNRPGQALETGPIPPISEYKAPDRQRGEVQLSMSITLGSILTIISAIALLFGEIWGGRTHHLIVTDTSPIRNIVRSVLSTMGPVASAVINFDSQFSFYLRVIRICVIVLLIIVVAARLLRWRRIKNVSLILLVVLAGWQQIRGLFLFLAVSYGISGFDDIYSWSLYGDYTILCPSASYYIRLVSLILLIVGCCMRDRE